ncbi:bifunctional diguanylate cyclase/phosphodiesterase [Pseudooceanicola sp. CBS1P-1]|uniref:EAL domain-containing protein n=1 Tax=Pseudooceanicola albus TaxID=2692189 RepID=A0A6L7G4A9_9RHOB|nr:MULTISPECIES: bifunctional diguanylate cyclase/phosphodiesterase [Pseudooceanicola]MBT9383016.1 bifunctional diguanylate cyclase/phosphodiesterase [Pseudooceanicola endophyticus]MXN19204.1 EAL domain-containing protein [Pseudooceanicola albus]
MSPYQSMDSAGKSRFLADEYALVAEPLLTRIQTETGAAALCLHVLAKGMGLAQGWHLSQGDPALRPPLETTSRPAPAGITRLALGEDPAHPLAVLSLPAGLPAPPARSLRALTRLTEGFCLRWALEEDLLHSRRRIRRLEHLARRDPLTGLLGRSAFQALLQQRIGAGETGPFALVMLEIEGFRATSTLYGPAFADLYLRTLASALRRSLPVDALTARLGGDAFVFAVPMPSPAARCLEVMLGRIRSAILRATARLGRPGLGRVRMGAALWPDHAQGLSRLCDLATRSLQARRDSGQPGYCLHSPGTPAPPDPRQLRHHLPQALARQEIVPFFQPIYDLQSGRRRGYEALARWEHPDLGRLMPSRFATLFEDHRHASRLTLTLARHALNEVSERCWKQGDAASVGLNLTIFDLHSPEIVFDLQTLVCDCNASWSDIIIEVTETVMMGARHGPVFRTLEELRRRGARIALDDFGTGYGSLRHLGGWPVDILKLDRGFIARMDSSPTDAGVVRALVRLARDTGLEIVAEGIETPAQLVALREMGCHLGQGYLFHPALPGPEIARAPACGFDLGALCG